MKKKLSLICLCLCIISILGCTRKATPPLNTMPPGLHHDRAQSAYWWTCRFKVAWPEDQPLDMSTDLMLAHQVLGPILTAHSQELTYWRFHRRAARDKAGHKFSFIFYASREVAHKIGNELKQNPTLLSAHNEGLIEDYRVPDPDQPGAMEIGAASDQSWPDPLQKTWPAYIMGVSALWWGLIDDLSRQAPPPDAGDIQHLRRYYQKIDDQIKEIWRQQGQHALLHHLNAVFGYSPLRIIKEMRF